jgi:Ca-activated chloride channel family protein
MMNEFAIDDVLQLKWLILVLACTAVTIYGLARRRQALAMFVSTGLVGAIAPDLSRARQNLKSALIIVAMIFVVIALTGPRLGGYWEDVQSRQLDMMVCLDVSRSMLAEDAGMSRLDRAKDDIKQLLDRLAGGRIGLVAFGGRADLICPLTDDYDFYRLSVDDIGPHSAPLGGTNIAEAIRSAAKAFAEVGKRKRVILVLTDGEDLGGTAVDEARKAHEAGMLVYAIGIGDAERGAMIPINKDGQRTFLQYEGQQRWSKMDPEKLRAIAIAGGGEYHPSGQVKGGMRTLEWLYTERLSPMEERINQARQVRRLYPRFVWPTAAAFALLLIESFLRERRSPVRGNGEGK